ncbi:inositol monophosphatase [Paenibacillus aurantius]|uniref:Inositol monophosphatase n=1 Tax=Paenibacillus aurantius TaxID=2918900 RepID=A0AA96LIC2_9BACL|nr:inositol monophosphatase [Paenibacillus aurantius]WNQ12032.1 inositol monophosphatase [Paenibacillus aurantius]
MREKRWEEAREAAEKAAQEAGRLAKERFSGEFHTEEKDEHGDLVTEVDRLADQRAVAILRERYPDHRIISEEGGTDGEEHVYVWHVDPLDGTNNYAMGLPLYGVSVSLTFRNRPVVGVVYDSHLEMLYSAADGEGARMEGRPIHMKPPGEMTRATLSWIQGHKVAKADNACKRLRHGLEDRVKRVLRVWAPSLTWAMLARGDLQGIVLYQSEGEDLYAGMVLAREAGAVITDYRGNPVETLEQLEREPYLVAAHPRLHPSLLKMVQDCLGED